MKKVFCVSLLALMLVCLLCASALAQTTGIAMDGKVYTFTGGEGTYQADGKTFIIGVESVVVQEPGLPDRVLELHQTEGTEIMRMASCCCRAGNGRFHSHLRRYGGIRSCGGHCGV